MLKILQVRPLQCRTDSTDLPEVYLTILPAVCCQAEMQGGWADEAQCSETIAGVFDRTGYLLDPHTAVAVHVADQLCPKDAEVPLLISSTAHYGKFASDIVETVQACSATAAAPEMLAALASKASRPAAHQALLDVVTSTPVHKTEIGADLDTVKAEIRVFLDRFFENQSK